LKRVGCGELPERSVTWPKRKIDESYGVQEPQEWYGNILPMGEWRSSQSIQGAGVADMPPVPAFPEVALRWTAG
jgi:hypothetical protein